MSAVARPRRSKDIGLSRCSMMLNADHVSIMSSTDYAPLYTDARGSFTDSPVGPVSKTGANLDFLRSAGPNLMNTRGIGTMITARQPRRVAAHCTPRFINICFENSGKAAPTADRIIVLAAKTEAALSSYVLATGFISPGQNSQGQVRVNQIVEALQEDHIDPKPGDHPTGRRSHPMD